RYPDALHTENVPQVAPYAPGIILAITSVDQSAGKLVDDNHHLIRPDHGQRVDTILQDHRIPEQDEIRVYCISGRKYIDIQLRTNGVQARLRPCIRCEIYSRPMKYGSSLSGLARSDNVVERRDERTAGHCEIGDDDQIVAGALLVVRRPVAPGNGKRARRFRRTEWQLTVVPDEPIVPVAVGLPVVAPQTIIEGAEVCCLRTGKRAVPGEGKRQELESRQLEDGFPPEDPLQPRVELRVCADQHLVPCPQDVQHFPPDQQGCGYCV